MSLNRQALNNIRKNRASRIVDMPLNTWKDVGDEIANQVRSLVRDDRVLGKLKEYSREYAELKSSRKAAPRQASTSTVPDLTLTGKMLSNFRRLVIDKFSVGLGFSAKVHKDKMDINASRGWDMLDNNEVLKPIEKNVSKRISKQFDKNIRKWADDDVVIQIG